MSFKSNKDLKRLQKVWYKKLAKSGFNDIETDEDHLKVWSTRWARPRYVAEASSRAAYYDYATKFLNEHRFDSELDKVIWEYHANGVSYRDIATTLRKARIKRLNKDQVWQKISALAKIMKQKYNIGSR